MVRVRPGDCQCSRCTLQTTCALWGACPVPLGAIEDPDERGAYIWDLDDEE